MATVDFFISRAGEDRAIATRIDETLRAEGYSTFIQDRDFGFSDFTARMDEGFALVDKGATIIALLSHNYVKKPHCMKEARYTLAEDPTNEQHKLLVLRLDDVTPPGFLKSIRHVDLAHSVGHTDELQQKVLQAASEIMELKSGPARIVAHNLTSGGNGVQRALLLLETEDAEKTEKAFNTCCLVALALSGGLIAFDFLLAGWNSVFNTNYYAIFDASFVFVACVAVISLLAYGYQQTITTLAEGIKSCSLSVSELRELRRIVEAEQWNSSHQIRAAVTAAIKKTVLGNR